MTADELAERAKTPGSTFPVKGTVYPKSGGAFSGEGTLKRTNTEFVLQLTFPIGAEAPQAKGGIYSREDFWGFEGIIGTNLRLVIEHLAPCGPRYWSNGVTSQEYETDTINVAAVGLDKFRVRDLDTLLARPEKEVTANEGGCLKASIGNVSETEIIEPSSATVESNEEATSLETTQGLPSCSIGPAPSTPSSSPFPRELRKRPRFSNGTWIHALVLNFPLIHTNGGTEFTEKNDFLGDSSRSAADTFSGTFDSVEFGLVRRGGRFKRLPLSADRNERRRGSDARTIPYRLPHRTCVRNRAGIAGRIA
jgi:hypothetical protein